ADAADRGDDGRALTELGPQPPHMDVHGSLWAHHVVSPNLPQELSTAERPPRVFAQELKKVVLTTGETHRRASAKQQTRTGVQVKRRSRAVGPSGAPNPRRSGGARYPAGQGRRRNGWAGADRRVALSLGGTLKPVRERHDTFSSRHAFSRTLASFLDSPNKARRSGRLAARPTHWIEQRTPVYQHRHGSRHICSPMQSFMPSNTYEKFRKFSAIIHARYFGTLRRSALALANSALSTQQS